MPDPSLRLPEAVNTKNIRRTLGQRLDNKARRPSSSSFFVNLGADGLQPRSCEVGALRMQLATAVNLLRGMQRFFQSDRVTAHEPDKRIRAVHSALGKDNAASTVTLVP
jgi:hypothetical protein